MNYYTILECSPTSTFEDLKKNYQRLIKVYHPDKGEENPEEFVKINEAWSTLKDDKLRKQYDAEILHKNLNDKPLIYAEINFKDLHFENEEANFNCRCGDNITIYLNEIEDGESLFECNECSNCILIKK
ncbi:DPH4 homolog [Onthophagus taurus]|uniref:DPH4 homolog n=1 Tax=Onthophagus taurus TaxID=166361 RepID=UPI0039BE9624